MRTRSSPTENVASSVHVLVIDDSAVVRTAMTQILSQAPGVSVAVASDPLIAIDKMARQRPNVILLDLELPRMDGLTFLQQQMARDPIPVVVCSTLAAANTEAAIRSVELGAVDVVAKPVLGVRGFLEDSAVMLLDTVRAAASARMRVSAPRRPALEPASIARPTSARLRTTTDKVLAIGASTGGTEAIRQVLSALPPDAPATAVVQHMPEVFTAAFARRLDGECAVTVKEAVDGDRMLEGRVLIAPGNHHLRVVRDGAHYAVKVVGGELVSRHRPSVDVLFQSVAKAAGPNAMGVILTGMGDDGADGLLEMKRAGAFTVAQDEASCVVFGMPREAIARGAVSQVVNLGLLPSVILRHLGRSGGLP